jgi:PRTRC genetic system protein B
LRNITDSFQTTYHPVKALLIYRQRAGYKSAFIEAFDIEEQTGKPINAHPLSKSELDSLAKALEKEKKGVKQSGPFLACDGLLPPTVLFVDQVFPGALLWYTPAQKKQLYFKPELTIADGHYPVPALLWCATAASLRLYALASPERPAPLTALQYAPFFNVFETGSVCMGTAKVDISKTATIGAFMTGWETVFFNSYFSHLNGQHQPVQGNIIQLWQSLLESGEPFPIDRLNPTGMTLDQLMVNLKTAAYETR